MSSAPRRSVPVIAVIAGLLAGCSAHTPIEIGASPPPAPASSAPPDCGGHPAGLAVAGSGPTVTATVQVCRPLSGADEYWIIAEPAGADGKPAGHYYPKGKAGSTGTSRMSVTLSGDSFVYVVTVPAAAVGVMHVLLKGDLPEDGRDVLPDGVVPASAPVRSTGD